MNRDAGRKTADEGTRARGSLNRLTPAGTPRQAPGAASSSSLQSVKQGKPGENSAAHDPEVESREAVRSRAVLHVWAGRLRSYGLALLLVAIGVILRMALTRWVGPGMPTYISFSPFMMLAALIGGLGPGLLATLATAVVVSYWLLPPPGSFKIASTPDAVGLVFFCVMGLLVSVAAELYRRTRDHLDELVVARTTALRVANARLQTQAETLPAQTQKLTAAEATLRRSESHLAQAQHMARVGSWSWDIVADRLYWSDEIYRLYGLQPGECVTRRNDFLRFVHPEDRQRMETFAREALVRRHYRTDYRIIRKGGEERHVHSEGETAFDDQGHPLRAEGILQDITERKRAEEVLKVKDSAIASSLNAIAMADLQGCLTYVNPAFLKLWGYDDPQQVLGKSVLDFWREPQQALEVTQAIQSGQGWEGELVAVRKDGSQLDLHLSANTVLNDQGAPICMMASFVDVTERKQAEEAIRVSEERLTLAMRGAGVGAWETDLDTGDNIWRKGMSELLGTTPEQAELEGTQWIKYIHPEDRDRVVASFRAACWEGKPWSADFRVVRADGDIRWLSSRGTVVTFSGGRRKMVGVDQDITERKQVEEALRESEQRYRKLFEANLAGVYLSKLDGTILDFNDAMMRMVGYDSREELLGRRSSDFYVNPESRPELVRLLQRDGIVPARETVLRRKDGSIMHAYGSAVLLVNEQTGEPYVQGVAIDITQRKEAEESLRELTRTLETKVAERTAELEHRTRQLQKLTLDMSEAEDRERQRLAEILHDDLQQIIAAAKFQLSVMKSRIKQEASLHALALEIDHLLKEAIEKSRGLSHELSPAVLHHGDFTETLDWLAQQMRSKHGLVVHLRADGKVDLPSDTITALLYRTAQELLFNVVKHARVKAANLRIRRRGRYICLAVSDRGRGFDPEQLLQTAGFGLVSIRERIELLGGRMKIRSAKDAGSTFFIVVPDGTEAQDTVG